MNDRKMIARAMCNTLNSYVTQRVGTWPYEIRLTPHYNHFPKFLLNRLLEFSIKPEEMIVDQATNAVTLNSSACAKLEASGVVPDLKGQWEAFPAPQLNLHAFSNDAFSVYERDGNYYVGLETKRDKAIHVQVELLNALPEMQEAGIHLNAGYTFFFTPHGMQYPDKLRVEAKFDCAEKAGACLQRLQKMGIPVKAPKYAPVCDSQLALA